MDSLAQDLRYTIRKLFRAPLFSVVALLTLAVGIGSNAAIFSVVNGVLLKPLPFEDPESLVGIWHTAPGLGFDEVNQSPALHFTYASEGRSFASVGMWDNTSVSVTGIEAPEQVEATRVTHETLPLLGVQPLVGRLFSPEEDAAEGPRTVLLSHSYWQRRFGGDPGAVGQTLTIDGRSHEVIGVVSDDFRFLRFDPAVYVTFRMDEADAVVGNFSYQGIGRLAPGATIAQANADVERMIPMAVERFPRGISIGMLEEAQFGPLVRPLKEDVVGDVGSVLWVLLGTVAIVLLIACANVANLFIVRAEGRHREFAVRTALGAGRGKLAGQLLLESLVLGVTGGILGLGMAHLGIRFLVALGPESLPRLGEIGLDPIVLAFTVLLSVVASILFGLAPTLQLSAGSLTTSLREGGRGGSTGRARHRARDGLVVAQMALALVLLTGSGLMIRSFQALRSVDPGFDAPEQVLTFRVAIPNAEIEEAPDFARAHQEILRAVRGIPGVGSVAFSSSVTMDGWDSNDALNVEEFPVQGEQLPPIRRFKWVGEEYFETMGNPLLAGRAISRADSDDLLPVVVVTEDLAAEYWATAAEAIGKRVTNPEFDDGEVVWREIVGVVGRVHDDGTSQDAVPVVYFPQVVGDMRGEEVLSQRSMAYAVRVRAGDPNAFLPQVRAAVWSVNPNLPLARVATLDEFVDESMARTSFTLIMLAIAAGVALFLGSVGIYGVISYVVAQRTREIGVRMALGAPRQNVRAMVLKQAGKLAAGGVLVGLVAAAGVTRLMTSLLYGVDPIDLPTFGAVALALSAVALTASYIPARRASEVDPVVALRSE